MNIDLTSLRSKGCAHVIDGEKSARIAVAKRLRRAGYQVRHYASIGEFLVRDPSDDFGCILTELQFGEGPDGFALLKAVLRSENAFPVVFMSASHDVATAVRAMKLGATDYLIKPLKSVLLFNALDSALNLHKQAISTSPIVLTERQETVLHGVVAGFLNRDIARHLQLSERTVKNTRASLMRRFSANSVADLLLRAAPFWIRSGNAINAIDVAREGEGEKEIR